MAVTGLAWPVLVWLTPAADRPWISGTSDNSIWSLILGYNGLGRLLGQDGGPGGGAGGGPGGGGVFGGSARPLRLLNEALGGQGGWLLGFAVVAGLGLAVACRLRRTDARTGWLLATGGAFLITAVAFSRAQGIFHPYYVAARGQQPARAGVGPAEPRGEGEPDRGDDREAEQPAALAAERVVEQPQRPGGAAEHAATRTTARAARAAAGPAVLAEQPAEAVVAEDQ